MRPATASPFLSPEYQGLHRVFQELEQPYGLQEILRFNRAYQPIYQRLPPAEKRCAEELVDALVEGVERRELRAKIFGVV